MDVNNMSEKELIVLLLKKSIAQEKKIDELTDIVNKLVKSSILLISKQRSRALTALLCFFIYMNIICKENVNEIIKKCKSKQGHYRHQNQWKKV